MFNNPDDFVQDLGLVIVGLAIAALVLLLVVFVIMLIRNRILGDIIGKKSANRYEQFILLLKGAFTDLNREPLPNDYVRLSDQTVALFYYIEGDYYYVYPYEQTELGDKHVEYEEKKLIGIEKKNFFGVIDIHFTEEPLYSQKPLKKLIKRNKN